MNTETLRLLDSIARDRNIERESLIRDIELAMVSALRKHFNSLDAEEFGCQMDRISGELTLWRNIDGGEREPIPMSLLGRIPAQTAKQVMIQKFREDERASLLEEYSKRQGEIVTGVAHRYEGGALVVQVDRAECIMPRSEQIPSEMFRPGDRVRCLILDVKEVGTQVKIIVSRSHPDFIRMLFEAEVPEVAEHVIEIKSIAREAGFRTKIAVSSIDSKVDPVGACVGVRGSRIRNIVDELAGEKIDIVRWNESSQILIANALKPAEVEEVSLCFELGRATIIVREDQLSLAIGRRGQNVRLAARLTGWDIDILTPAEFAKGLETLEATVKPLEGITGEILDRMGALGMISVFDIEEVGIEALVSELGVDEMLAAQLVEVCASQAKIVAEQQAREKEEEEARRKAEQATAEGVLGSGDDTSDADAAADHVLGGGGPRPVAAPPAAGEEPTAPGEGESAPVVDAATEEAAASILDGSGPTDEDLTARPDAEAATVSGDAPPAPMDAADQAALDADTDAPASLDATGSTDAAAREGDDGSDEGDEQAKAADEQRSDEAAEEDPSRRSGLEIAPTGGETVAGRIEGRRDDSAD